MNIDPCSSVVSPLVAVLLRCEIRGELASFGLQVRQDPRQYHGRRNQKPHIEESHAEITNLRKKTKEHRPECSCNPSDVVTEAGTGGSQHCGKQWRKVHGE